MRLRFISCVTVIVLLGCSGQKSEAPSEDAMGMNTGAEELRTVVPAGHTLLVGLEGGLSTDRNDPGDIFTGVLLEPLTVENRVVVSSGALVTGRVDYVNPPADGQPATMSLSIVDVGGDPAHTNLLKLEASPGEDPETAPPDAVAGILGDEERAGAGVGTGPGGGPVVAVTAHDRHIRLMDGQKMLFKLTEPYVGSGKTT